EDVLRVLASSGESAALALAESYDLAAAPASVQQLAATLTPTGRLRRPTVIAQGTLDRDVPAILSLRYFERVLDADAQGGARFYLLEGLDHVQVTNSATLPAAKLLLQWMRDGTEPHDLVVVVPGVGTRIAKNSRDAGFENNPCGYFDYTVKSSVCRESGL